MLRRRPLPRSREPVPEVFRLFTHDPLAGGVAGRSVSGEVVLDGFTGCLQT